MKTIEIWKTPIYDGEIYEGYKVSNLGKILSLNYRNTGRAELMKPFYNGKGYLQVALRKNGKYKECYVHRLVAEIFLENPENKPEINHKIEGDEGKTMNMVIFNEDGTVDEEKSTIEWATYEENNNYATRNERISKAHKGEKNHFFGKHHSDESKKKMSDAKKGKHLSEEHKRKLSDALKGEKNHNYGKQFSDETRKKMSEAAKRREMLKKMQPDGCLPLW